MRNYWKKAWRKEARRLYAAYKNAAENGLCYGIACRTCPLNEAFNDKYGSAAKCFARGLYAIKHFNEESPGVDIAEFFRTGRLVDMPK